MSLHEILDTLGATWAVGPSTQISLIKANGSLMTAVKVELVNQPGTMPGTTQSSLKISFRPEMCLAEPDYGFKWITVGELPSDQKKNAELLGEIAALYVYCMPIFKADQDYTSFETYARDFKAFEKDVMRFLSRDAKTIISALKDKIDLPAGNELQSSFWLLKHGLGITEDIQQSSLAHMLEIIDEFVTQKGVSQMADTKPMSFRDKLIKGAKDGAARGAIGATNRRVVKMIVEKLGDKAPDFLHTPVGQKALEGAIPGFLLFALSFPQVRERLPAAVANNAEKMAELAWNDFAGDGMAQLVEVAFDVLGPLVSEYAAASELLGGTEPAVTELDEPSPRQRQAEAVDLQRKSL